MDLQGARSCIVDGKIKPSKVFSHSLPYYWLLEIKMGTVEMKNPS